MKKLICALLVTLTTVANAGGYISNKNMILWDKEGTNKSYLIIYMMAVNDVYDGSLTCVPLKTEGQVLYDTTMAYIKLAALDEDAVASTTIAKALKRAYPCIKKVPML